MSKVSKRSGVSQPFVAHCSYNRRQKQLEGLRKEDKDVNTLCL